MSTVTAENYLSHVLRTESTVTHDVMPMRLQHAISGMVTEAGELSLLLSLSVPFDDEKQSLLATEECGNAAYYLALGCDALPVEGTFKTDMTERDGNAFAYLWRAASAVTPGRTDINKSLLRLARHASVMEDERKRATWYGKVDYNRVSEAMTGYSFELHRIMQYAGLNPDDVFAKNAAKLKARYPEKFTVDAAVNRDVEHEYAAMREEDAKPSGYVLRTYGNEAASDGQSVQNATPSDLEGDAVTGGKHD